MSRPSPSDSADKPKRTGVVGALHDRFVFHRRTLVLADHLARLIAPASHILDVGCGDGTIDCLIKQLRPDVSIEGIDPLIRSGARIPVHWFDGAVIPFPDRSFDVVLFVDVLHHTADPRILLREAARVGKTVLIKDHLREGWFAQTTLRIMDWVGNAHHGVVLPYNYWDRKQWQQAFYELSLLPQEELSPKLYPIPFLWIFGRNLHFIARLVPGKGSAHSP